MLHLQNLKKLISIDTQNPGTDYLEILAYLSKYLKQKKARVYYVKKNLIAIWGKPKLLINAHMDTVKAINWRKNPLKAKIKNNKIFGLGTADTKGNIFCALELVKSQPENLMLLFSVDEEFGKISKINDFIKSKYAKTIKNIIVLEPTENRIVSKHPGYYSFWLKFNANSGHTSTVKENAIKKAATTITKLKEFNVGLIESKNISGNVSAAECKIKISIRTYDTHQKIMKKIKKLANNAIIEPSFVGLPLINYNPFLKAAKDKVLFWSEAAVFSHHSFNTILYGAGSIKQAHTQNEYVSISSLERCVSFLKRLIGEYS